jgi:hypothetical protein
MGGNGGARRLGVVATYKHPRIAPSLREKKFRQRFDEIIYSLGFFFIFKKNISSPPHQ